MFHVAARPGHKYYNQKPDRMVAKEGIRKELKDQTLANITIQTNMVEEWKMHR